jgi:hypothetical protein
MDMLAWLLAATLATTNLTVTVWPKGENGPVTRWTLRCQPTGGTHPHPAQACRVLSQHAWALEPVPPLTACTMIWGGPQLAHVDGVFRGRTVHSRLNRKNGCETARWNALVPLVPRPNT